MERILVLLGFVVDDGNGKFSLFLEFVYLLFLLVTTKAIVVANIAMINMVPITITSPEVMPSTSAAKSLIFDQKAPMVPLLSTSAGFFAEYFFFAFFSFFLFFFFFFLSLSSELVLVPVDLLVDGEKALYKEDWT